MPANISRKELVRKFKALGFSGPHSGKKHQFMKKGPLKIRIPNPHSKDISTGLVKRIIRQADITDNQWDEA